MRRWAAVTWGVITVAALSGAGLAAHEISSSGKSGVEERTGLPKATDKVVRNDLISSTTVEGTLGYAKKRKVNAGAGGTVTWLPGGGSKITRKERLYAVDGRDVRLMYGSEPMYRTLKKGNTGTDVRQLKTNLIALGYGIGLSVDEEFTQGTEKAVKRWQKDHGLKVTGTIGPDQVFFATGPVRVRETQAAVGDRTTPGQPVLSITSSDRVVQFDVKVVDSAMATEGKKVEVELPDGKREMGEVTAVANTAKPGKDPSDTDPRVSITVAFDHPDKVRGIDKAPVTIHLKGETRENVLSVPVSALLALPDNSYGVQVVEGTQVREVKVRLGLFAQGRVEVTGGGLREGMRVGVPSI
ncbi:peptidoglycan-binding protein [Streptomyces sp. NPDC048636]|uniref:peptidoglycan-binding protein n=1 Tax=Streptomyces sp. NPDC048636 TaxID=3155762 RepID=UPI0034169298